jgi:hypothetical protein
MAFLAQDRRKPKTFQAPHYQRDPPGVQVFMGGTIRETPKARPDDHHGNPTPNRLCFPCCLLFKFSSLPFVEHCSTSRTRTIGEAPKELSDDHHGNPKPDPFVSFAAFCSNSLRCLLLKIVRPLGRGRLERRRRSYQMTITETQSPIPLFPLLPSVQILFAAFC